MSVERLASVINIEAFGARSLKSSHPAALGTSIPGSIPRAVLKHWPSKISVATNRFRLACTALQKTASIWSAHAECTHFDFNRGPNHISRTALQQP